MRKSTADGGSFDEPREQGPRKIEVGGDADAVQKTTYVVGQGTDPAAADPDRGRGGPDGPERGEWGGYTATVRAGGGVNVGLWVIAAVALLIALVYGFGLFT